MQDPGLYSQDETTVTDLVDKGKDLMSHLLSKWKPILICATIFALLGLTYSLIKKTKYEAFTTFTAEQSGGSMASSAMAIADQFGISGGSDGGYSNDFFVGIIESRRIIKSALLDSAEIKGEKNLFANHFIEFFGMREDWEGDAEFENFVIRNSDLSSITKKEDSILSIIYQDVLDNYLIAQHEEERGYVSVSIKCKIEEFAQKFCFRIVDESQRFYIDNQTKQSRETIALLEARRDSVFAKLQYAELKLARLKDSRTRLVKAEGYIDELTAQRDVAIRNIMYSELVGNLETARFALMENSPILQIIDRPEFSTVIDELDWWLALIVGFILGGILATGFIAIGKILGDVMNHERSLKSTL